MSPHVFTKKGTDTEKKIVSHGTYRENFQIFKRDEL
jgi:hypothetical protein